MRRASCNYHSQGVICLVAQKGTVAVILGAELARHLMSLEISLFEDLLDDFVRVIRAELIRKSCLGSTIVGARHARSASDEDLEC